MAIKNHRLGELLVQRGVISREQLHVALEEQQRSGKRLGQTLVTLGLASEKQILRALTQNISAPATPMPAQHSSATYSTANVKWVVSGVAVFSMFLIATAWLLIDRENRRKNIVMDVVDVVSVAQQESVSAPINQHVSNTNLDVPEVSLHAIEGPVLHQSVEPKTNTIKVVETVSVTTTEKPVESHTPTAPQAVNAAYQPPQVVFPTAKPLTTAVTEVSAIRFSVSSDDMRIVFESEQTLEPFVTREYLENYTVVYRFSRVALANMTLPTLTNKAWLSQSRFQANNKGLTWRFQMRHAGTAKYHTLPPKQEGGPHRFVVIIRPS